MISDAVGRVVGFFDRSILRKVLISLLAISIVTYAATALVVFSGVRSAMIESDAAALDRLAALKSERLDAMLQELAIDFTSWASLDVMNELATGDSDGRVNRTLEDLRRVYALPGAIYVFGETGRLVASSESTEILRDAPQIPDHWKVPNGGLVFLDKHIDPLKGTPIIALSIPIMASFIPNYRLGTLVVTYPWRAIEQLLFSSGTGTILLDNSNPPQALADDRPDLAEAAGLLKSPPGRQAIGIVVGEAPRMTGALAQWQVVTVKSSGPVAPSLWHVADELLMLGGLLALPILVFARMLSHRLTQPILDLTRVVSDIADTDRLDARAPVLTSDEFGTLARAFNRMTEGLERAAREREQFVSDLEQLNQTLEEKVAERTGELEAAIEAQQRLIGDISHEIKSPLARLSVALELARRSTKPLMAKQFDRMETEIEGVSALASELLTLARLGVATSSVPFASINVSELVGHIVADARYEAGHRSADLIFRQDHAPLFCLGNAGLLRRAIENVVRNALFYTADSVAIEITLGVSADGQIVVTVKDGGPGVPESALDYLFEPFYRVDPARNSQTGGAGLGLSICQRVVTLHGGRVSAGNVQPHGLLVTIILPQSSEQTDAEGG